MYGHQIDTLSGIRSGNACLSRGYAQAFGLTFLGVQGGGQQQAGADKYGGGKKTIVHVRCYLGSNLERKQGLDDDQMGVRLLGMSFFGEMTDVSCEHQKMLCESLNFLPEIPSNAKSMFREPPAAYFFLLLICVSAIRCSKDNDADGPDPSDSMYFPLLTGTAWESRSVASLGWNEAAVQPLLDYLQSTNSRSFMILVNGRIVMEQYFDGHTPTTTWPWNSAGKTLVTAATGIAQQEGLLVINTPVSNYLGNGWTSAPLEKERLITPSHLLTMTSGLNDDKELVTAANLTYLADAGARWSYHNVFQKQMDVVAAVSGGTFDAYVKNKIGDKIGMDGFWNKGLIFTVYHSTTRGMARFGLLALNQVNWNGTQVVPADFFRESIQTSQTINP